MFCDWRGGGTEDEVDLQLQEPHLLHHLQEEGAGEGEGEEAEEEAEAIWPPASSSASPPKLP